MKRKLNKSESIVFNYFTDKCKFEVDILEEGNLENSKSPDFFVRVDSKNAFFCEVKSMNPLASENDPISSDTIYNKITRSLDNAVKQFKSKNRQREFPNIIAWTSKEMRYGIDLIVDFYQKGAYTGSNEYLHPINPRFYGNDRDGSMFIVDAHLFFDERFEKSSASIFISSKYDPFKLKIGSAFIALVENSAYATENSRYQAPRIDFEG